MRLKVSIRGGLAVAIALVTVIVSGVIGALAETAPGELDCRFVAVGTPLTTRSYPSAEQAATAFAKSLSEIEGSRFPGTLAAVDVTGTETIAGAIPEESRLFAIRGHGRTVALVVVSKEIGSWVTSTDYVC
jgi:hypothetical protein